DHAADPSTEDPTGKGESAVTAGPLSLLWLADPVPFGFIEPRDEYRQLPFGRGLLRPEACDAAKAHPASGLALRGKLALCGEGDGGRVTKETTQGISIEVESYFVP